MSKLETVRRLSDSAPPLEGLRATMELQQQIAGLTQQVKELGQTLTRWAQASTELSTAQRRQVLDLAVLIEPIAPVLAQIHQKQQEQDERQAKLGERLARLEAGMNRVTAALPSLRKAEDNKSQVQPKLVSRDDLVGLPSKVWDAKPSMFGKP
jgi:DNA repair exonuclease SbcCD ATPase subunit